MRKKKKRKRERSRGGNRKIVIVMVIVIVIVVAERRRREGEREREREREIERERLKIKIKIGAREMHRKNNGVDCFSEKFPVICMSCFIHTLSKIHHVKVRRCISMCWPGLGLIEYTPRKWSLEG